MATVYWSALLSQFRFDDLLRLSAHTHYTESNLAVILIACCCNSLSKTLHNAMSLLNDSNCSCNLLSSKTLHYAMSLLHYITSCCNRKFGTKTFKSSGHCVNTPKLLGRVIHCKTEGWMRNSSDSRWTYPSAVVLRIVLHQAQCKSKTRGISSICTNSNSIGITSGNLCVCVCVCVHPREHAHLPSVCVPCVCVSHVCMCVCV